MMTWTLNFYIPVQKSFWKQRNPWFLLEHRRKGVLGVLDSQNCTDFPFPFPSLDERVHLRRVDVAQLLAQQPGCWLRTSAPVPSLDRCLVLSQLQSSLEFPPQEGFQRLPTVFPLHSSPWAGAVAADCAHGESLWGRAGAASSIPSGEQQLCFTL